MKLAWTLLLSAFLCVGVYGQQQDEKGNSSTFTNPLLPTGPDPWVELSERRRLLLHEYDWH